MWFNIKFSVACLLIFTTTSLLAPSLAERLDDDDGLIVQLVNPSGKIRGHVLQTLKGNDYYAFQDIPYAKPPVGEYRFKHPQPLEPWTDILDTVDNVKYCPQQQFGDTGESGTEDCLVLNVYTPLKPGSNASLPVFFMIHGGGYIGGSGELKFFNPQYFIDEEIVVVTINYRLGALGFLTMDDKYLPGNLGLKDQHFALKWTRDNIHLFNGDPDQITLDGESAGAMSAGQQFISEQNEGWIKGVISQSGAAFGFISIQPNFKEFALRLGKALDPNFTSNKSEDLLNLLLKSSAEDIVKVQTELVTSEIDLNLKPIIESADNEGAFLTGPLHNRIMTGQFNLVPLMLGFNSEEYLFFVEDWTDEQFAAAAKVYDDDARLIIPDALNVAEEDREQAGLDLKALYTSSSFEKDKAAYIRYNSDKYFVRPTVKQAEGASQYVPVYLYEFSWNDDPGEYKGVPHSLDVIYLWTSPSNDTKHVINETLRTAMIKLWSNFIKTQNPTPEADEDYQNIIWPQVKPNAVKYLNLNKTFEILENPRKYYEIRNVIDKVIQPPFNVY